MTYDDWKATPPDLYDFDDSDHEEDPMADDYEPAMADFVSIRNRIRETHLEALAKLDDAEAAAKRNADAGAAVDQLSTGTPPTLADALAALVALAPAIAEHTYRIDLSCVDEPLWAELAGHPAAKFRRTLYHGPERSYVIEVVSIPCGPDASIEAQHSWDATAEDLAAAEGKPVREREVEHSATVSL